MRKFLVFLCVAVVLAACGGATYYFLQSKQFPVANPGSQISQLSTNVKDLQNQVAGLQKSVNNLNPVATDSAVGQDTHSKIAALEKSVTDLQTQVKAIENSLPIKLTSQTSNKPPLYIPFGSNGQTISVQYVPLDTPEVAIDPADYPGYTSMQLEISLKVDQGNGKAYAMLYEANENLDIPESEVSTTNQDYDLLGSSKFTLPKGKKTYKIALKTTTGYTASFQDAKIRVNFN